LQKFTGEKKIRTNNLNPSVLKASEEKEEREAACVYQSIRQGSGALTLLSSSREAEEEKKGKKCQAETYPFC